MSDAGPMHVFQVEYLRHPSFRWIQVNGHVDNYFRSCEGSHGKELIQVAEYNITGEVGLRGDEYCWF